MNKSQTGSTHIIIIIVLAVALVATLGFTFWQNFIAKPVVADKVATYADCIKSEGSMLQETYPETCITKSGERFTNTVQKADVVTLKNYCTPIEKLCFDYPNDWTVTSEKVNPENDGVIEQIIISDQNGKTWLQLGTGIGGLGGACGNIDGSYITIQKTHTTKITGSYLVNPAAKDFVTDTAYALSWTNYNGTSKMWTIDMELNNSKTALTTAKADPCDIGIGVINGKNAKANGSTTAGAVAFKYYTGSDTDTTYPTEAAASAALGTTEATQAYAILQSARYE